MRENEMSGKSTDLKKRHVVSIILVLVICVGVGWTCFYMKDCYYIDEIWSYSLSNSYGHPFLFTHTPGINGDQSTPAEGEWDIHDEPTYHDFAYHWIDGEVYNNFITVQNNHRFDYANVYRNQEMDTHPFLYYCLLHTVCSFFPNEFSWWFGWGINILFYLCTLILIYRISRLLFNSHLVGILSMALWGISRAGISDVVFLRMYMMLTFLSLLLVYATLKMIDSIKTEKLLFVFLINLAGFLTQYYFYIFSFFLTASVVVYYLIKQKWICAIKYGLAVLLSAVVSMIAFPAIFRHAFSGTWNNVLEANTQDRGIIYSFDRFLSGVFNDYFGVSYTPEYILALLFFFFVLLLIALKYRSKSRLQTGLFTHIASCLSRNDELYERRYIKGTILVIVMLTGTFIAWLSPSMGVYFGRYYLFLSPCIAISIAACIIKIKNWIRSKLLYERLARLVEFVPVIAIVIIVLVIGNIVELNPYVKLENENTFDLSEYTNGKNVILCSSIPCRVNLFATYLRNSEKAFFAETVDNRVANQIMSNDNLVVLVEDDTYGTNMIKNIEEVFDKCGVSYKRLPDYQCGRGNGFPFGVFEVK